MRMDEWMWEIIAAYLVGKEPWEVDDPAFDDWKAVWAECCRRRAIRAANEVAA